MTKDLQYYVSNLESMAKGLECDLEFNWPGKDPATLEPFCSCGAREEPNVGTVLNRIQFFRELAEILQAAMPMEHASMSAAEEAELETEQRKANAREMCVACGQDGIPIILEAGKEKCPWCGAIQ